MSNDRFSSKPEEPSKKAVVSAPAEKKKNPIRDIGGNIIETVVKPTFKSMLYNAFTNGLSMALFGRTNGTNNTFGGKVTYLDGSTNYVNYSAYANGNVDRFGGVTNFSAKSVAQYEEIEFETESDARAVLETMKEDNARYGFVKVSSYYEYARYKSQWSTNNYGWTNVRNCEVKYNAMHNKWYINLPKPQPLD